MRIREMCSMEVIVIKVVKFGGSSLASAEQFAKVGNIIHADKERKFVDQVHRVSVTAKIQRLQICFMHVMHWQKLVKISEYSL